MKHNWEYKPVSEIFDTVTDFVAAGSFADLRENVIYNNEQDFAQLIRTTDLKNNFSNSQFVYVNEHAFNYLWRVNLAEECIILPNIGNCGEVYYLHPSMLIYPNNVLGPNAIMVRSKKHNQKYLAFALKGKYFQRQLFQIVSQVAQSKFNKTNLKKLIVPVPSLEVQERIVAELDKINETIEDCRELLRNLDALAQSLFYDYFGDIYTNPKGWVTCKLGDVSEKISNGANTKIELDTYKTEGIMFFRCQNVWRNRFDLSDIVFVDDETNSKMKGSILKHNDLLVTKIGRLFTENSSLGRVALYEGEDYKANLSGNLSFIRLKPIVAPKFILYILISDYFRDYVRNTTSGGIDKRALNNSQLKELQIYLPPLELQEKFAERIEQIEAQKKAVEQTIAELQTLLDSRMDYWFN